MTTDSKTKFIRDLEEDPNGVFTMVDPLCVHPLYDFGPTYDDGLIARLASRITQTRSIPSAMVVLRPDGHYALLTNAKGWHACRSLNALMPVQIVSGLTADEMRLVHVYDVWRDADRSLFVVAGVIANALQAGLTRQHAAKRLQFSNTLISELLALLAAPSPILSIAKELPRPDLSSLSQLRRLYDESAEHAQWLIDSKSWSRKTVIALRRSLKRVGEGHAEVDLHHVRHQASKLIGHYVVELFGKRYRLATDRKPATGKAWLVDDAGIYLNVDVSAVEVKVVDFAAVTK